MSTGKDFHGTYLGISPSDESDSGYGEAEVVIDDEKIVMRFATGLGIDCEEFLQSKVAPLTSDQMLELLLDVSKQESGFRISDQDS